MSLFPPSLGVTPSKSITLYLPVAYAEIAICNDDYKFAAFSHSILQEFKHVNEVTGMFHPLIVIMLHSQCRWSYRVLRGIASITNKLDIS